MTLCIAFSQKKGTHSQAWCEQDKQNKKIIIIFFLKWQGPVCRIWWHLAAQLHIATS